MKPFEYFHFVISPCFHIMINYSLKLGGKQRKFANSLSCQQFKFFRAEGLSQFAKSNKFYLTYSLLAYAKLIADLLERFKFLFHYRAGKTEMITDNILLSFCKIILYYLLKTAASLLNRFNAGRSGF